MNEKYPREVPTYVQQKTCTKMFTAALLQCQKHGKNPNNLSVGEWIKNCDTLIL